VFEKNSHFPFVQNLDACKGGIMIFDKGTNLYK